MGGVGEGGVPRGGREGKCGDVVRVSGAVCAEGGGWLARIPR